MHLSKQIQILFLSSALLLIFALPTSAALIDELKGRISDKTSEIEKIEAEIAQYQKEIDSLGGEADTLKNSIRKLDATRKKLEADIRYTQTKINSSTLKIEKLALEIGVKSTDIKKSNKAIGEIIRKIDEAETDSLLEVILSNDTFSSFLDDIENLKQLQSVVSQNLKELEALKADLETIKLESEGQKRSLVNSRSELGDRKKITENNKKKKRGLLVVTKNKESNYKKLLIKREEDKKRFEEELRKLESQLRFELDPNTIPPAGSGLFAPPLPDVAYVSCYNGNVKAKNCLTQYFGNTKFAKSGAYNGRGHNGTDFRAAMDTPVKAVLGGEVIAVNTKAAYMCQYGRWVLIKHNNGLTTLYAHLDIVKVKKGQEVNTGDLIAYSGDSGYSTGPHLHLTTYASQAVQFKQYTCNSGATLTIPVAAYSGYLNPLDYL